MQEPAAVQPPSSLLPDHAHAAPADLFSSALPSMDTQPAAAMDPGSPERASLACASQATPSDARPASSVYLPPGPTPDWMLAKISSRDLDVLAQLSASPPAQPPQPAMPTDFAQAFSADSKPAGTAQHVAAAAQAEAGPSAPQLLQQQEAARAPGPRGRLSLSPASTSFQPFWPAPGDMIDLVRC